MSKKKQIIRIILIPVIMLLIIDFGLKVAMTIQVNQYGADFEGTSETINYVYKVPQNPETINNVTFDLKFGLMKTESIVNNLSVVSYKNEDNGITVSAMPELRDNNLKSLPRNERESSFLVSLMIPEKSFTKYYEKNNITSYGALVQSAYKDEKAISVFMPFYPLPLFRQEYLRALYKETLGSSYYNVILAESEDYYVNILYKNDDQLNRENGTRENNYIFRAYKKDDCGTYGLVLQDSNCVLTKDEVIDFFETVSFE